MKKRKLTIANLKAFSTPRRLAVLVLDVDEAQEDIQKKQKVQLKKLLKMMMVNGQKQRLDFQRGQGMSVDDIYFKEINGVEYAHVKKFIKGQETINLLPELKRLLQVLLSLKICVGLIKIYVY